MSIQVIYSFKEHIFVQVQGHMFIQGSYIHSMFNVAFADIAEI